jgi:hypothetical protein
VSPLLLRPGHSTALPPDFEVCQAPDSGRLRQLEADQADIVPAWKRRASDRDATPGAAVSAPDSSFGRRAGQFGLMDAHIERLARAAMVLVKLMAILVGLSRVRWLLSRLFPMLTFPGPFVFGFLPRLLPLLLSSFACKVYPFLFSLALTFLLLLFLSITIRQYLLLQCLQLRLGIDYALRHF